MKKFLESWKMKLLVMSCLVLSMMLCTVCAAEGDGSSSAAMSTVTTACLTSSSTRLLICLSSIRSDCVISSTLKPSFREKAKELNASRQQTKHKDREVSL